MMKRKMKSGERKGGEEGFAVDRNLSQPRKKGKKTVLLSEKERAATSPQDWDSEQT